MKRALIGAAGILVLAVAIQVGVSKLSVENLRPVIAAQLGEAVGLEVRVEGDLWVSVFPALEIHLGAVKVANLPGRPSRHLLEIEELRLELRLRPLLRRVIAIDSIEIVDAALRIEPDEDGDWSLRPDLEHLDEAPDAQARDPLELRLRHIGLHNAAVFYDRANSDDATTLFVETLDVQLASLESPVALTGSGRFEGSAFEGSAQLGSIRELLRPTQPFPVELRGRFFETELEAQGTLRDPTAFHGVALRFRANISDLAVLNRDLDRVLPPLGRVRVSGLLEDPDGTFGIRELKLRSGESGDVQLAIEGSIRDLSEMSGVELRVSVDAEDAEVFEAFTTVSLPHAPVRARLELSDDDGSLGIEGEASTTGPLDLDLRGAFDDLRRLQQLNVRVQLGTQSLATLPEVFGLTPEFPIPALGPLRASGNFVDRDGVFGLGDLDIEVGAEQGIRGRIRGEIHDLQRLRGLDLRVDLEARSAQALAALYNVEIPDLGSILGEARLSDHDGSLGVEAAQIHLSRPGAFELTARGGFDDLRELDEIEIAVDLRAEDLRLVGELIEVALPAIGPAVFRGTLRGSDEHLVAKGTAQLGQTEFQGDFSAQLTPGGRPHLVGSVRSPHVFLPDLGIAPNVERRGLEPDGSFEWKRWWRGEQRLALERLRDVDVDLVAHAEKVTGRRLLELQDLRVTVHLEDGELELRDVGAQYQGGRVKADLQIDVRPSTPTHALQLEAFNLDMTRLASQIEQDPEQRGLLDLSIDLRSKGADGPQFAKALSGRAGGMLREGSIVSRYTRAFSLNFLRVSIPQFRASEEDERPVRCLLALFDLDRGVGQVRNFYLEGLNITITGAGSVDLPRDEVDLRLTPHVHKPGLVSAAATVDVSGPLANPRIRAVRRSLAASAARALVRNALRPVRAARRILPRNSEDLLGAAEPCDLVALQRVEQMGTPEIEPIDLRIIPVAPD